MCKKLSPFVELCRVGSIFYRSLFRWSRISRVAAVARHGERVPHFRQAPLQLVPLNIATDAADGAAMTVRQVILDRRWRG